MNLYKWSTTAANNNAASPDGAPEGWTGADVNNWGREVMARVREQASDAAYVDETYNLTAVGTKTLVRNSTTQFQVNSANAVSVFTVGRRIRIVGATTDYGFVTSRSFSSPNTIVNVEMDSGDVPTSPTQAFVHVDAQLRAAAYKKMGAGNELDADLLDGYHASDLMGPAIHAEALVNGSFLVWQRATASTSAPAATRTMIADRWFTNPAGAAVTVERTTSTPTGAISPYALKVTGATSVTTCALAGQRIESYLMPYIKTTVTISALVKNDTGASLTLTFILGTPGAADDFTTVTQQLSSSVTAITSGSSQRVWWTVDISALTNINNGLELKIQSPSGALNSAGKSITTTEIQIDRASTFSFFRLRPIQDELIRCKRYFRKTFNQATPVAQNSGSLAGALHCQMNFQNSGPARGAVHWAWDVPMRSTPTITTYNPNAADANWDEIGGSGSLTPTVLDEGDSGAFIYTSTDATNSRFAIHATASAEL